MKPIRTIDREGIEGILSTGKPAGLWMAEAGGKTKRWIGVAADGMTAARTYGSIGEVLTWLQLRQGIRPGEARRVTEAAAGSRRSADTPVRIEGAVIRPWERGSRERDTGPQENGELLRLMGSGLSVRECAERTGMRLASAYLRLNALVRSGQLEPLRDLEKRRQASRRDKREDAIRTLAKAGMSGTAIARALRCSKQFVSVVRRKMREEGGDRDEMQGEGSAP